MNDQKLSENPHLLTMAMMAVSFFGRIVASTPGPQGPCLDYPSLSVGEYHPISSQQIIFSWGLSQSVRL